MSELYPAQVQHFLDKSPEDLAESFQKQSSGKLSAFLVSLKETLIKFPKSPSLLKLQQYLVDELMNRERKLDIIHKSEEYLDEDMEEEAPNDTHEAITGKALMTMEFPEEEWLIDKIVPQAGITMFVGEAAAGKSFIALDAVRALTGDSKFLDNFEVKTKCKVLIIDKENGLRRIQKRMKGMQFGDSEDIFLLKYPEHFDLKNGKFMQSVSQLITTNNIKLVVMDSFVDVLIGSENDAGDTNEVFNLLRSISSNVNWFILHHDSKPMPQTQRSAGQKTRGSSNIIAQVDNQFYIEKTKNPMVINIEQGKSRDNEPVKKFQLEFINENDQMSGFKYLGEVQDEVAKVDEAADFIINYLTQTPYSHRKDMIENATGTCSKTAIDRAIKMLKEKQVIDSKGEGRNKTFFVTQEIIEEPEETWTEPPLFEFG
jgi:hypothetical protein